MVRAALLSLSLVVPLACQSAGGPAVVDADPARRDALFEPVRALEGTWKMEGDEEGRITFAVSSNGSVVRELMFPGAEHEMTNMYSLDGNSLLMTHYCAGGNQPRMRATALEGDRIVFRSDGVTDLKSPDEQYMAEMTLVFVDDDHVEQHWKAFNAGSEEEDAVFRLEREP